MLFIYLLPIAKTDIYKGHFKGSDLFGGDLVDQNPKLSPSILQSFQQFGNICFKYHFNLCNLLAFSYR